MRCDMAAQMEVLEEINATRDRQCAAQAAGHAATARFLEHRVAALEVRLDEIMGVEPAVHRQPSSPRLYPYTPTETGLSAAVQRLADIVLMRKRRAAAHAAAHAATDAEILRLGIPGPHGYGRRVQTCGSGSPFQPACIVQI